MSGSLHALFTDMPGIAQLILEKSGGGHELQSICKLRACRKSFRDHEYMEEMYKQQKALYRGFFSGSAAAYDAVHRGDSLGSSFETLKTYLDQPFFFDAMRAMLKKSAKAYSDAPEAALHAMAQTRLLLETYNWVQFCEHIRVYHRFHDIVGAFLDYILDIVVDVCFNFVAYFTMDGITTQAYEAQKRLLLANMGDAGVVHCLWTVCAHHRTREDLQSKLMHVLCEMIQSSSVCPVKDVLKTPGSMRVFEEIAMNTEASPSRSPKALASNVFLNHYAQLVHAMLLSEQVFEEDEEIRVVGAVHAILEKRLRLDCISVRALCLLLESICTRTRLLTAAQIAFLRNNEEIKTTARGKQLVERLLYRVIAANNNSEVSGVHFTFPPMPSAFLPSKLL